MNTYYRAGTKHFQFHISKNSTIVAEPVTIYFFVLLSEVSNI